MKYKTESEVMQALKIDSWRNLSKDKVIRLAALMPEMDKEVPLRIIAQLPEFTKFAKEVLADLERAYEATLASNAASQEHVHQIHLETLAILKGELDKDLTPDKKTRVLEHIMTISKSAGDKDTENKKLLRSMFNMKVVSSATVLAAVLVFVGARVVLQGGDGGDAIEV